MQGVPVSLIAAYEGVSTSAIRNIIARHQIQPVGSDWKAKLYDPAEVHRVFSSQSRAKVCERCSRRHREPQAWCSRCMCESLMREVPTGRSA